MAYEVVWSNEAINDLENIAEYINKDSLINAKIVVTKFVDLIGNLGHHPKLSSIVQELNKDNIRQKLVYDWRVIYKVDDKSKRVIVLTIIHGKRQFNKLIGNFISE
jgi:plasmid stabilization system protein ParE